MTEPSRTPSLTPICYCTNPVTRPPPAAVQQLAPPLGLAIVPVLDLHPRVRLRRVQPVLCAWPRYPPGRVRTPRGTARYMLGLRGFVGPSERSRDRGLDTKSGK